MIPILLDDSKTLTTLLSDSSNGLGKLSEVIDATVIEERNGEYDLTFRIPMNAKHFDELHNGGIVRVKASETSGNQMFRIYKISKPLNGIVTVECHHISYDLNKCAVKPFTATGIVNTINGLIYNEVSAYPFTMNTTLTNATSKFTLKEPMSFRGTLGGYSGSVLDVFGGEYLFNNLTIRLLNNRGADNGVTIRYGKNLVSLQQEENIDNTYSAVLGFATVDETTVVSDLQTAIVMTVPKIKIVDFSNDFEAVPTKAQLNTKAQQFIANNDIGKPHVNLDVSFVALWQTEEYKDIAPLERVSLCDTVTVEFPKLGVSSKAKVIRTEWDVINERYNSIELGDARSSFAQSITDTIMEDVEKETTSWIDEAVNNATELITGGLGGYVVIGRNASGEPEEILIMDQPDKASAVNVIRMNKNGIGFSTTGYQGPFTSAWTIDGAFVADFITSGTLRAINIEGVNISGSNLRFGSDPYVQVQTNSARTGVLFSGAGTVQFQTIGEYNVQNFNNSNALSNSFRLSNTSTQTSSTLTNYWNGSVSNMLYYYATSDTNASTLYNYKTGTTNTANSFSLNSNSTDNINRIWLYNNQWSNTSYTANWLRATSTSSTNFFGVINYKIGSSNGANNIELNAESSGTTATIRNYVYNQTNTSNLVQCSSNSTANTLYIWNYSSNGNFKNAVTLSTTNGVVIDNNYGTTTTSANQVSLQSASSTNTMTLKNNRTNSTTLANSITFTAGSSSNELYILNNKTNGESMNSIRFNTSSGLTIANNVTDSNVLSNSISMNDSGLTIQNRYGGQIFAGQNEAWIQYGSRKLKFDSTSSTVSQRGVQLANDIGGSNYILLRDDGSMDIWAQGGVVLHRVERIEFTNGTVLP